MKKKVLLISRRSTKPEAIVRYWPGNEWDLYLYTFGRDEWFSGMSEQLGGKWISLPQNRRNNGASEGAMRSLLKQSQIKYTLKTKTKKARKYFYHKIFRIYDKYFWKWGVPSFANLKLIVEKANPDLVMSVYGPLTANLIARRVAVSRGIPWIAYFRDHCTTFNLMHRVPILWQTQTVVDRWVHSPLNSLAGVSPEFVDILSDFYGVAADKSHVITGTFDDRYLPADIKERCLKRRNNQLFFDQSEQERPNRLKINYAGKLFDHRIKPLLVLLTALEILLKNRVPCDLSLTVSNAYYCFPKIIGEKIEHLKSIGLNVNTESSEVSYDQALRQLDKADVNVILEGLQPPHSTAGTLTLKIFDLMMIAKPAMAICADSLPIGDYLRESGIGVGCSEVEGVVETLTDIWRWKQNGQCPTWYAPNTEVIDQYSCRAMAEKINELCEQVYNHYCSPTNRKQIKKVR